VTIAVSEHAKMTATMLDGVMMVNASVSRESRLGKTASALYKVCIVKLRRRVQSIVSTLAWPSVMVTMVD